MQQRLNYWLIGAGALSVVLFSVATVFLFRSALIEVETHVLNPDQTISQFGNASTTLDEYMSASTATTTSNIFPVLTFTGDIMMARSVELWMKSNGMDYPFRNVAALVSSSSGVVSNFESAIPIEHTLTPSLAMRFSVDKNFIPALRNSGITHVSLANNHTLDYGQTAYLNTREVLSANNIVSFGHSTTLSTSSITYIKAGSTTVSILAIHTLFVAPNPVILSNLVTYMKKTSDVQLAFMHWGTEYKPTHDASQVALANYLATLGVDGIIGSHPHVVEDIQRIGNVPVFYSLGNFIFDQYFSEPVQKGLLLRVTFAENKMIFQLVPVTSIDSRGQPRAMTESEQATFLANLASKSDPSLTDSIKSGKVIFELPLVKTEEDSII